MLEPPIYPPSFLTPFECVENAGLTRKETKNLNNERVTTEAWEKKKKKKKAHIIHGAAGYMLALDQPNKCVLFLSLPTLYYFGLEASKCT